MSDLDKKFIYQDVRNISSSKSVSSSRCKSAAVSTDSFAATRCAAPLKRATTDWYYHIGKGTRLLISLSFCHCGREKKEKGRTIGLFLCPSAIGVSLLTTILHFDRLFGATPFRSVFSLSLSNPRYIPLRFLFPRASHLPLFPSRAHPILVHEDFNLVSPRHWHVLIFLLIFSVNCGTFFHNTRPFFHLFRRPSFCYAPSKWRRTDDLVAFSISIAHDTSAAGSIRDPRQLPQEIRETHLLNNPPIFPPSSPFPSILIDTRYLDINRRPTAATV